MKTSAFACKQGANAGERGAVAGKVFEPPENAKSAEMSNITEFPDLGSVLTGDIIKAAIEVHRVLGPGLLESVYESCLYHELETLGLNVEKQVVLPVAYKDKKIDQGFRIDLWVNKTVIIEVKACEKVLPIHEAQLVTYLKLSKTPLGLILNFNERLLKDGIKRLVRAEFAENSETEKSEHQR